MYAFGNIDKGEDEERGDGLQVQHNERGNIDKGENKRR